MTDEQTVTEYEREVRRLEQCIREEEAKSPVDKDRVIALKAKLLTAKSAMNSVDGW